MTSSKESSVLGSSAVMAAGTVVSRLSGYVRNGLLLAALGTKLHADVFNIANTIPNMLYILLAGGVFNAVLVPQLVRSMKNDEDGGEAYTNRIITLAGIFLAAVVLLLVVAAPLLMRLYLGDNFYSPDHAAQRESAIAFARYCLPQVFFYGMFVLVGQILNARHKFGPMMWAPIANNLIAIAVLVMYLLAFGPVKDLNAAYTGQQELLLGLGSSIGIAAQFLILLPYLRAAGFSYKPRFDFRGTGLGHTLRLGIWTVLFVVVNQVAYTVVVKLASNGAAGGGTGYTIYSNTFLVVMTPHAIATVSLATATLPRLSAYARDGDLAGVGRQVASTLRSALALIIPFALVLPVIALPVSNLVSKYGAASNATEDFARSLSLFAIGLVFFTSHYLVLRGFYALELTRTVFWVQCVISGVNIVLAVVLTHSVTANDTAPRLVLAYAGAYLVGAVSSYLLLRHILGGLGTNVLVRFLVRLLLAGGLAALATWGVRALAESLWAPDGSKIQAIVMLALMGVVDLGVLGLLARAMRIQEVNEVVELFTRRLRRSGD